MRLHLAEAYSGDCRCLESLVHLVTVHCTLLQVSTNGDISDVAALLQSRPKPAPPQVCSLMCIVLDSSKSVCCNPIGQYMVANLARVFAVIPLVSTWWVIPHSYYRYCDLQSINQLASCCLKENERPGYEAINQLPVTSLIHLLYP